MPTIHIFSCMKFDRDHNTNHFIMDTWKRHVILWLKDFFCNIRLLHHYILIFEGIFWVSLVDLVLADVFNLGLTGLPLIFSCFHILHHSALSFHKIYALIHSWLHSGRPNVSFYYDKWVSIFIIWCNSFQWNNKWFFF